MHRFYDRRGRSTGGFAAIGYDQLPLSQRVEMEQDPDIQANQAYNNRPTQIVEGMTIAEREHRRLGLPLLKPGVSDYQRQTMMDEPNPYATHGELQKAAAMRSLKQMHPSQNQGGFARIGDDVRIGGEAVTSTLTADAQRAGMNPDDYAFKLENDARQKAAQNLALRQRGEIKAGTKHSKIYNDPRMFNIFQKMSEKEQAEAFRELEGYDLAEALQADTLGEDITVSGLRAKLGANERQKGEFDYFKGLEGATGANAFDIVSGYDPKTQISRIKGKMVQNKETGDWEQAPDRELRLPPAIIERIRQGQARISGYNSVDEMQMSDPAYRRMQELAAREAGGVQPAGLMMNRPAYPMAEEQRQQAFDSSIAPKREEFQMNARRAAVERQVKMQMEAELQAKREAEAMKYWQQQNAPPVANPFQGRYGGY